MQFFIHFLLFLSVSVATSAAGSHYGLNTKGQPHKRVQEHEVCEPEILALYCNNGYYQEIAELAYRCNNTEHALLIQGFCSEKSNGEYCINSDLSVLFVENDIEEVCNLINNTCAPECMSILNNTVNELECCLNTLFRLLPEITPLFQAAFNICSIELVTEMCSRSSVDLSSSEVDPSCMQSEFEQELLAIECSPAYVRPAQDILSNCEGSDEDDLDDITEYCAVNDFGRYCELEPSLDTEFSATTENCRDLSCTDNCVVALENLVDAGGCCINYQYNDSRDGDLEYEFFDYFFWLECGVETPGFCKNIFEPMGGHAAASKAPVATVVLAVAVFLAAISGIP